MNKSIKIVPSHESDISAILHFITQLAKYEKLEHEVVATEDSLRKTLFGDRKYAEVIFLEEDGQKAGFALFFHSYSTFLALPGIYLEDLFVLPEHRGKGYGKKLLCHLAKVAVDRGCGRLEWSVLDWNKPAIDFYLSLGSKPMDEWTVHRVTGESLKVLAGKA
ncbi:N-acetyltransferase family protein [Bdellovibrio sp. HCB290]|uniref:GNAT family N-acetyltransferase n=1 Tax=Bdellovibrio sp. HCB290 TaxID=3394356 RepID=UPI0039B5DD3D